MLGNENCTKVEVLFTEKALKIVAQGQASGASSPTKICWFANTSHWSLNLFRRETEAPPCMRFVHGGIKGNANKTERKEQGGGLRSQGMVDLEPMFVCTWQEPLNSRIPISKGPNQNQLSYNEDHWCPFNVSFSFCKFRKS